MAARKHHGVFCGGEADHALTLSFIRDVGRGVVYTVDVVHVEDSIVVL